MTPHPLLRRLGFHLEPHQQDQLHHHLRLLRDAQSAGRNLVASGDLPRLFFRHTLDSLLALPLLPPVPGLRLLDIGSGAGFPGIPLQIVRPDLHVDLLESSRPRALFLKKAVRALHLASSHVLHARAQELLSAAVPPYDLITTRAFAPLPRLLPLALPLLAPKGLLVVYKGPAFRTELAALPPPLPPLLRTRTVHLPPLPPTTLLLFGAPERCAR